MKILVIGAGMIGRALAYDCANSPAVDEVLLADIDAEKAGELARWLGPRVRPLQLDVRSRIAVVQTMAEVQAAIGATSYQHNVLLTECAIEAGVHFCDLGGNMDVVRLQCALGERASRAGVCILPNCGLAPGMACIIAAGAAGRFSSVDEIHIRVGGLPLNPVPPLNYQLVFSPEGLVNEYIEPAEVLRGGEILRVESMTECEEISFPPPFGVLEAFHTSGGISTLTRMFRGKARDVDYKTIRYRGHCEKFKTLLDLGFASSEPLVGGGSVRTAREFFEQLLRKRLPANGPDAVLMRIAVSGTAEGSKKTLAYEMVDYYDTRLQMTAMMRTTAYPTSIAAQMIVDGAITARGVFPPEQCVPAGPLLRELKKRNIIISESWT